MLQCQWIILSKMLYDADVVWYLEKPLYVLDSDFRKLKVWNRAQREACFYFRDENETLFLSISGFATRMKIETVLARIFENEILSCFWTDISKKLIVNFLKIVCILSLRNINEIIVFQHANKNIFLWILSFLMRTRNEKLFLKVAWKN